MIFSPPRGAAAPRSPLPACAAARRPRERPARACSRRTRRPGAPPAGRRCRRRRPRRADERRARPAAPDRFVAAVPPRVQCAAVTTVPGAFAPPGRILLGPGPSDVHPRVLAAMAAPLVGHLDPVFVARMEEVKALLRFLVATENALTIPISGTGSAGMEACVVNLVEPGDEVVVGVNGVFGTRLAEVATRAGAVVVRVEAPWGRVVRAEQVEAALKNCRQPKVVALIHAETSTGAWQPLEDAVRLAHDHGAPFLADGVTSLGGVPVEIDGWGVDAAYGGTPTCLSCRRVPAAVAVGARGRPAP